jgi:Zn-dependent protease
VGGFNMIPVPPLDGSKIWKWSIPVYILMWVMIVAMGAFLYVKIYM